MLVGKRFGDCSRSWERLLRGHAVRRPRRHRGRNGRLHTCHNPGPFRRISSRAQLRSAYESRNTLSRSGPTGTGGPPARPRSADAGLNRRQISVSELASPGWRTPNRLTGARLAAVAVVGIVENRPVATNLKSLSVSPVGLNLCRVIAVEIGSGALVYTAAGEHSVSPGGWNRCRRQGAQLPVAC